jgi:SH3-like domain-containing protein
MRSLLLIGVWWLGALVSAQAAEFRSVAEAAAVLYDAPSAKSKKLFVIGRDYPLEVVVVVEGWTKVRDAGGELTWIESRHLSERRTVMVKVRLADVRTSAADNAPLAFQAEQSVLLSLLELTATGWARVAHRDGQSGFIKTSQVWGL